MGPMGEISAALRRIKNQNVNILEDKAKVCAMLSDLEPSMHKERRRVRLFYETGAVHSLKKAVSNPEGARLYLSQAVNILTDQADMNASAAAETINYFTPLWNLPQVEDKGGAQVAIDTDAMFEMMAKADNEKKAAAAAKKQQNGSHRAGGRAQVYGQRTAGGLQNTPAFNRPLRHAGRQYGQQQTAQSAQQGMPARQVRPRRIYGSSAGASSSPASSPAANAPGGAPAAVQQAASGQQGMFSRHGQQQNWKNIAVRVRQTGGGSVPAVSPLTAAMQAAEDLCRFYRPQLEADGSDVRRAEKLCRRGVLLTALAPSRAVKCFLEAAREGDVAHLSLIGRQIIAWQDYLEIEASMGFACLQLAVDRGAENGAYALAHCYHTGTGILRCGELAEKYYRQAAAKHPEIIEQINRRIDQLHTGQMPSDTLWRYY